MAKTIVTNKLEYRAFLLLLALVSVAFLYLLKPFFAPVFWAVVVSLLFHPVQQRLESLWGHRPNITAGVTLLLGLVLVVMPTLLLMAALVHEAAGVYQQLQSGELQIEQFIDPVRDALPPLTMLLDQLDINTENLHEVVSDAVVFISRFAAQHALLIGQSTFQFFLKLILMLYVTFFLLRDGRRVMRLLSDTIPLGEARKKLLFGKFAEVTRATVKGNLVVAMVQGALGGIIFWILGIPAALLWAMVMAILSLLPAVGTFLVWAPVAVYLFATGEIVSAIVLAVFGALVIGLADNLLRPILIGRDTKLPDWIVLLSTLGGLILFGITGFVLGPLIAALFIASWQIFSHGFNVEEGLPVENDDESGTGVLTGSDLTPRAP